MLFHVHVGFNWPMYTVIIIDIFIGSILLDLLGLCQIKIKTNVHICMCETADYFELVTWLK